MTPLTVLTRTAGLGLCVVAFAGTALADPGNGNGNGPAVTPPGQERKAETPAATAPAAAPAQVAPAPAPQAAKGQAKKAENAKAKAPKQATPKPAAAPGQAKKAEKQAEHKPAKAASPAQGRSAEAHHHVIVCHRTGSASNPYVVINIPLTAWSEAHSPDTGSHPDLSGRHDILLKDPASGPGTKDGFTKADCGAPAAPAPAVAPATTRQETGECPTTTTERVLVGVWHATGAVKDGQRKFVFISPSEKSAHFDKHEDDVPVYEERAVTTSGERCEPVVVQTSAPPAVPPAEQPQPIVPTPAGQTPAPGTVGVLPAVAPAPAGEVLGAVSPTQTPAADEQPAGGVLGAVASAPAAIARTATSGNLPFTGLPLWLAALVGAGLLTAGLALRRSA